ncbi:MAG: hypothetical protein V1645_00710 [archaeon]
MQSIVILIGSLLLGYVVSVLSRELFGLDLPAIRFYIFIFLVPLFMFLIGILAKVYLHWSIFPEFIKTFPEEFTQKIALWIVGLILGAFLDKLISEFDD